LKSQPLLTLFPTGVPALTVNGEQKNQKAKMKKQKSKMTGGWISQIPNPKS
jgi:hypothetical protein